MSARAQEIAKLPREKRSAPAESCAGQGTYQAVLFENASVNPSRRCDGVQIRSVIPIEFFESGEFCAEGEL